MTALLEQKRQISLPSVVTEPALWGDSPVPLDRDDIDLLLDGMSDRADELADTLKLIRRRLSHKHEHRASLPVLVNEPARLPAPVVAEKTWRLAEGRFSLLSPDGESITLSRTEQQFLLALFQAPGRQLTYEQAYQAIAPQPGALPRSHGSLSVLLSRLRTKFRKLDLELPLHTVRGQGYVFAGATTILPT
ncbi:helix-turn-helix domain-containing protein [Bordetella sp. N]|uniref:helix-turn-helix domain-containing protein n=1 Tax=Bordetella sp. N TaxID=1746199 RepID=UPI0018D24DFC|nr:helix-turn-helix domain-containing protein [Bordetella sp. N]